MEELNVFDKLTAIATPAQLTMFGDSERSRAIAEHKAWLQSIRHERPNTEANYKIGIYIRYFNQTKYEDYLSYAFFIETYTGGAHPTHDILTFVFDTRNDKFITANDIFNDENLKKISKYSREKLLKDSRIVDTSMLLEGTKPNIDNFKNFVFSNNLIIIFNEYQIAPYSSGIISLDIPYSIIK